MGSNDALEIIFIDDEQEVSDSYLENFQLDGFQTKVFVDPNKAIAYVNENLNKIVLIFSDQNMPQVKGTDIINHFSDDAKDIPLIIVSGFLDTDLVEEAMTKGVLDTLPKPLKLKTFEKVYLKHGKEREENLVEEKEMIQHFLEETGPLVIEIEEIILDLDAGDDVENRLKDYFRILHTIKGTGACLGLKNISAFVHKYEDFVGEIRDGIRKLSPGVNALLLSAYDLLKEIFNYIKEHGTDRTIDVDIYTEELKTGIANIGKKDASSGLEQVEETSDTNGATKAGAASKNSAKKESMTVSLNLLDEFNELSGEVTVLRNSIMKSFKGIETHLPKNPEVLLMGEMLEGMHKVVGTLQNKITEMRKIPLKNVFRQFKRVIRDVSKNTGKDAELIVIGDDLRVDNQVGNILSNTLVHLIRNSVDHGLEDPATRTAGGKVSKGTVTIEAIDSGEFLQVLVKDDGRGISREKIEQIAIEKGLGTHQEYATYSDSRIFGLIFESGFSTAEVVTDISGRGVGMDMVKNSIEKAGGEIVVESTLGKGTVIRLNIPYPKSVLIINSVLVSACQGNYLIPSDDVVEVICLEGDTKSRIEMIKGRHYFRTNGLLYPVLPFDEVLGTEGFEFIPNDYETIQMVKLRVGNFEYFIVVDNVLDLEEIVKKPLTDSVFDSAFAFCGASVLGTGDVALIIDAERIMTNFLNQTVKETQAKAVEEEEVQVVSTVEYLGVDCEFGENLLFELKDVFRLEKIKSKSIQISGNRRLMKYRGEAIPIVFLDQFLNASKFSPDDLINGHDEFDAVMLNHNDQVYCVVVESIKDIMNSGEKIHTDLVQKDEFLGVFYVDDTAFNVLNIHTIINSIGSVNREINFVA